MTDKVTCWDCGKLLKDGDKVFVAHFEDIALWCDGTVKVLTAQCYACKNKELDKE